MTNLTSPQKWYNKTWLVLILCIVFFPVGLYALWKHQSMGKGWKISITIIIAIAVLASLGSKDNDVVTPSKKSITSNELSNSDTVTEHKESKPGTESSNYIQDLAPADIYLNLENKVSKRKKNLAVNMVIYGHQPKTMQE